MKVHPFKEKLNYTNTLYKLKHTTTTVNQVDSGAKTKAQKLLIN